MVLLATWLAVVSYKDYSKTYYDAHTDFERSYSSGNYAMGELESTRESAIRAARLKLNQYWVSCLFLVLAGVSAPLLTARHLTKLLQRNLDLLNLCITHPESDCEELQTQRFDLDEFDQTYQVVKESGRIQKEAELRSREAEAQLVEANDRLQRRAAELNQKSSDALSMMKEAELARAELERVNNRLNLAIGHAKESARQADTASKAKSDFLATMSHEIRTPLNGVIGFMEMLNMTELNEEQREYAESVKTSGEALMALINDVLDFSKIESGHLDLEARQFDLVATIRDTVSVFTSSCEKKGLKLIVDIEDGVPAQAVGDENRVRQILNNLLANSVKFTASGSITVKASNCSDASAPRCDIKLEVTDTGIGMSEAQLHRLFRPFAQGDSSMTRKFGGTGLGLA
ncbi:MAG TPA: hypothetical protein DCX06_06765, partial [Opitutae bacterium]|nr:hypothetical protein [Opitutae bacterium]